MAKPVQRKRYKNKQNITCEQCINCMYIENGDKGSDKKSKRAKAKDEK